MKRIRFLEISGVILAVLGAALIAFAAYEQHRLSEEGYAGSVYSSHAEFETPRSLVVNTVSMPVAVRYGDTDRVQVSWTGSTPLTFDEKKKPGTLYISEDDRFTMTLLSERAAQTRLEIVLPHKVYEHISLSSSSGSVEEDRLNARTLEFGTKSGDLKLYGIDERASLRTESGKLFAEFSSFSGDMNIKAGAGDVTLLLPEELSVYLEFFTESGSFTSDRFDQPYREKRGDAVVIYNGARAKLNVTTTSGNLYVF